MSKAFFTDTVKSEWLVEKIRKKDLPWYKRYTRKWIDWTEDRKMKILQDFSFIDSNGTAWVCKKGSIVDGASIPRPFWKIIGPPLTGSYRRSSVIHDVYCDSKARSANDTHRVFYEMMRADGVPINEAKIMYWAVKTFGPKW